MKPNAAWCRAFASTIAKGMAEGYIAAQGGNGVAQGLSLPTAGLKLTLCFIASNALWDLACFIRANADCTLPPAKINLPVQTKPESAT